jgi:hypothetical protein
VTLTIIAPVVLAFGLASALPAQAQESSVTVCTMDSQFTRQIARARDAGIPSEKVITMINEQRTVTADQKAREIGVLTIVYGNRSVTPDELANEALLLCMKKRAR